MSLVINKEETIYKHRTRKHENPNCFIIHTTGTTNEKGAINYYRTSKDGIAPHFMINTEGKIYQFVDLKCCAHHAGISFKLKELYKKGFNIWSQYYEEDNVLQKTTKSNERYNLWKMRWNLESPLKLITKEDPNDLSIGIECLEPKKSQKDKFTDAQYISLNLIIKEIAPQYNIPISRNSILGHYDVNPLVRSSLKGDRDPGYNFNWDRILK